MKKNPLMKAIRTRHARRVELVPEDFNPGEFTYVGWRDQWGCRIVRRYADGSCAAVRQHQSLLPCAEFSSRAIAFSILADVTGSLELGLYLHTIYARMGTFTSPVFKRKSRGVVNFILNNQGRIRRGGFTLPRTAKVALERLEKPETQNAIQEGSPMSRRGCRDRADEYLGWWSGESCFIRKWCGGKLRHVPDRQDLLPYPIDSPARLTLAILSDFTHDDYFTVILHRMAARRFFVRRAASVQPAWQLPITQVRRLVNWCTLKMLHGEWRADKGTLHALRRARRQGVLQKSEES